MDVFTDRGPLSAVFIFTVDAVTAVLGINQSLKTRNIISGTLKATFVVLQITSYNLGEITVKSTNHHHLLLAVIFARC